MATPSVASSMADSHPPRVLYPQGIHVSPQFLPGPVRSPNPQAINPFLGNAHFNHPTTPHNTQRRTPTPTNNQRPPVTEDPSRLTSLSAETPATLTTFSRSNIPLHSVDALEEIKTAISKEATRHVMLNYCRLSDSNLFESDLVRYLLDCSRVETLEMFGNQIGPLTCQSVAERLGQSKLTKLKLAENVIRNEGCRHLAQGLRENLTLVQLQLGFNEIEDDGVEALTAGLLCNRTLTSLGLRNNRFGARGMYALATFLKDDQCALSELQLKHNRLGRRHPDTRQRSNFLPTAAESLAEALLVNRSLRVLELEATGLDEIDMIILAEALQTNPVVHALNVNDNTVGDRGTKAIGQMLCASISQITTVGLRNNNISVHGLAELCDAIALNCALTGLDLGMNRIGSEGVTAIAQSLVRNSRLQSIDLHSNHISSQGVASLASSLNVNTTLTNLDLGTNFCGDFGALHLGIALAENSSLTRLCLTDNEISNRGGEKLAMGLSQNTTLRFLPFGGQSTTPPCGNTITGPNRSMVSQRIKANLQAYNRGKAQEQQQQQQQLQPTPTTQVLQGNPQLFGEHLVQNSVSEEAAPLDAMVAASPPQTPKTPKTPNPALPESELLPAFLFSASSGPASPSTPVPKLEVVTAPTPPMVRDGWASHLPVSDLEGPWPPSPSSAPIPTPVPISPPRPSASTRFDRPPLCPRRVPTAKPSPQKTPAPWAAVVRSPPPSPSPRNSIPYRHGADVHEKTTPFARFAPPRLLTPSPVQVGIFNPSPVVESYRMTTQHGYYASSPSSSSVGPASPPPLLPSPAPLLRTSPGPVVSIRSAASPSPPMFLAIPAVGASALSESVHVEVAKAGSNPPVNLSSSLPIGNPRSSGPTCCLFPAQDFNVKRVNLLDATLSPKGSAAEPVAQDTHRPMEDTHESDLLLSLNNVPVSPVSSPSSSSSSVSSRPNSANLWPTHPDNDKTRSNRPLETDPWAWTLQTDSPILRNLTRPGGAETPIKSEQTAATSGTYRLFF